MRSVTRFTTILFLLACIAVVACSQSTRGIKLRATKDAVMWMYRGQPDYNFGAAEPIFVEGVHYCTVIDFDVSQLSGSRVESARLWLHQVGDYPIMKVLVSGISRDWIEGSGDGTGEDREASSASYIRNPRRGQTEYWAGPGSDITDVIMGHGNTFKTEVTVQPQSGGWQTIDIPADMVHAMLAGLSHGIVLVDAKGQLRNEKGEFIHKKFNSRSNSQYAPYLEVVPAGRDDSPAAEITSLTAAPLPKKADFESGAVRVVLKAGDGNILSYEVALVDKSEAGAKPEQHILTQNLVPYPGTNEQDTVIAQGLKPDADYEVYARAVARNGNRGAWKSVSVEASDAEKSVWLDTGARETLGGRIKIWVSGVDEKVNPVTGRLLEENPGVYAMSGRGVYPYMLENHIWDAADSRVSIEVPRGGTAAFNLIAMPEDKALEGISVRAESIYPGGGKVEPSLFLNWYIKSRSNGAWYPEVAIPFDGNFSIPNKVNGIEGQRNQSVLVEYFIPRDAKPGIYNAKVVVGARGLMSRTVNVRIRVHEATLPLKLPFITELNVYSPVNTLWGMAEDSDEYYDMEEKYYVMAHDHLTTINQLPYGQDGSIKAVGAPKLSGSGADMKVSDWSEWDKRWSRYLDGSAFAKTDRPVPVPVMYLPFHENWPGDIRKLYKAAPKDTGYVAMMNEHTLNAPPIEKAFDEAYAEEWVAVMKQFIEHFRAKGWDETEFQVYLNNKYYRKDNSRGEANGSSWWLLDEPYQWDDFLALQYYGDLFNRAAKGVNDVDMIFRGDISRPHLMFGVLTDVKTVIYTSAFFYQKNNFLRWRHERYGDIIRNYCTFNGLDESNTVTTALPLRVFVLGGTGTLPWQTIGSDRNFDNFNATAVIYPGKRFGIQGPVASLRLKAAREGTEIAVLLNMLAEKRDWSIEQCALAVAEMVDLGGGTITRFFDDAGSNNFDNLSPADITRLKRAILFTLDES